MEKLIKALERRELGPKKKLSERILEKAKYQSKKRGAKGRWIYKYGTVKGKVPKVSLYAKQQRKKKAEAAGEKRGVEHIPKEYKKIMNKLSAGTFKNLQTASAHGMKLPTVKALAEESWKIQADIFNDDHKYKREVYSDMVVEEYNKMSEGALRDEIREYYGGSEEEEKELKKMTKEDMVSELTGDISDRADELSGEEVMESVYGSPEQMVKEGDLSLMEMTLEMKIDNYLDENDLN